MTNEGLPTLAEQNDSVPNGVEVVSGHEKSPTVLEPELLERVEEAARVAAVMTVKHERHSGPMPSPKSFGEYDSVLPGTALVIRNEFESNSQHVRRMEEKALQGQISSDSGNRQVAERLLWGAFGLIALLALTGHDYTAMAVAGTTVAAIITGFLSGRRPPKVSPPAIRDESED